MKTTNLLSKGFHFLLSLPKTIYFNYRVLPLIQAIKLPIYVGFKVKLITIKKGIIELPKGASTFTVRIGSGGSPSLASQNGSIRLEGGKLVFLGTARMGEGTIINVKGNMVIGNHFTSNKNCLLSCTNSVTIGDDVLFGWDCHIFDDNGGHKVLHNGVERKKNIIDNSITIGNHVWICSYAHLLAGSAIGSGSIVGYKSLLTKKYDDTNVLVVGIPAKIKEHNVTWSI